MTDISPENVARMLEGVTPGPWEAEGPEHSVIIWGYADRDDREYRVCFMTSDGPSVANARFIAWAREAVPALAARLAEVEASIAYAQHTDTLNDLVLMGLARDAAEAREAKLCKLVTVAGEARLLIDTGFCEMGETVNYPPSLIAKVCEMLEPHTALQGEAP